mmetsp:Transcript_8010/g.19143  ORF Transcript_8010/g.19143 Transcript_8010/m.19143 type:complete len:269 (-) Transcript_8010:103-909(-)
MHLVVLEAPRVNRHQERDWLQLSVLVLLMWPEHLLWPPQHRVEPRERATPLLRMGWAERNAAPVPAGLPALAALLTVPRHLPRRHGCHARAASVQLPRHAHGDDLHAPQVLCRCLWVQELEHVPERANATADPHRDGGVILRDLLNHRAAGHPEVRVLQRLLLPKAFHHDNPAHSALQVSEGYVNLLEMDGGDRCAVWANMHRQAPRLHRGHVLHRLDRLFFHGSCAIVFCSVTQDQIASVERIWQCLPPRRPRKHPSSLYLMCCNAG